MRNIFQKLFLWLAYCVRIIFHLLYGFFSFKINFHAIRAILQSQKKLDIPTLLMITVPRLLVFVFLVPVTLYSWFPRRSARGGT